MSLRSLFPAVSAGVLCCAAVALTAPAVRAQGITESFIGLTNGNQLFRFSASTTAAGSAVIPTTNLAGNAGVTTVTGFVGGTQFLQSIDFRPSNGLLYGLTSSFGVGDNGLRLYTINTATGAASLVS